MGQNYKYYVRHGDNQIMTGPFDRPNAIKFAETLAMCKITATVFEKLETVRYEDFYDNKITEVDNG